MDKASVWTFYAPLAAWDSIDRWMACIQCHVAEIFCLNT